MSDVPMHPQPPSHGDDPYGQSNPADPNGGLGGDFGAPQEDQSWLLDDGPDPVLEPLPYEAVQALPDDLAEAKNREETGWLASRAEEEIAPEPEPEPELLDSEFDESIEEYVDDGMGLGATSYVEPEPPSRPYVRAIMPGAAALLLSFGGIALWSSLKTPEPNDEDVEMATVMPENAKGNRGRVQLADPDGTVRTTRPGGRMEVRGDGSTVPVAGQTAPSIGRSATVDTPREPGELAPDAASPSDVAAPEPPMDDAVDFADTEVEEIVPPVESAPQDEAETSESESIDSELVQSDTIDEDDALDVAALDDLVIDDEAADEVEDTDAFDELGADEDDLDALAAALEEIGGSPVDEEIESPFDDESDSPIDGEVDGTLAAIDPGPEEDVSGEVVAVDEAAARARLDAIFGSLDAMSAPEDAIESDDEPAPFDEVAQVDRPDEAEVVAMSLGGASADLLAEAAPEVDASDAVEPQPTEAEPVEPETVEAKNFDAGDVATATTVDELPAEPDAVDVAQAGPASPFGPAMALPPLPEEPESIVPAEDVVAAEEPAAEPLLVEAEPVEVEVRSSIAGEGPRKKRGGVLVRADEDIYWQHKSVPKGKFDAQRMVMTPNVGSVRVVFHGGETIDGRLHAVGQNKIVVDTKMGRMTLDARRTERVDRLTGATRTLRSPSQTGSTAGLKRVRVRAKGGTFYGFLVSEGEGKVTLLLDEGFKITLESDDVSEVAGSTRLRRIDPGKQ
ncbi:MAG: hypothetical protein AAGA20_06135 [Planctomycetota bacterium]